MPEWWVGPLVTVLVAIVATSAAWATVVVTKRQKERELADAREKAKDERIDKLNGRVFTLINYAQRLRDHLYRGDPPPPEEWPRDIYD